MTSNFLLDEHLPRWWPRAILQQQPDLVIWCVGDPGAPPLQAPDPAILEWCEVHHFLLLTNNRKSMPGHLRDHLERGRHIPGILVVDPSAPVAVVIEDVILIAGASLEEEYRDQIRHLPFTQ